MEREGHARVHSYLKDDDSFNLGGWVARIRRLYFKSKLTHDRIQKLETIEGWVWDLVEVDFLHGLGQLKKFVESEGHAVVGNKYIDEDDFPLGPFGANRRKDYKYNRLTADRIEVLEAIEGWDWDPLETGFLYGLGQLKKFVECEGHARVPSKHKDEDNFALGGWVSNKRKNYKNNRLSAERIEKLEAIEGWVWAVR